MTRIILSILITILIVGCTSTITKEQIDVSEQRARAGEIGQVDFLISALPSASQSASYNFRNQMDKKGIQSNIDIVEALGRLRNPKAFEPISQIALGYAYGLYEDNPKRIQLVNACLESLIAIDPFRANKFLQNVLMDSNNQFKTEYDHDPYAHFNELTINVFFKSSNREFMLTLLECALGNDSLLQARKYQENQIKRDLVTGGGRYFLSQRSFTSKTIEDLFAQQPIYNSFVLSNIDDSNPKIRSIVATALRDSKYRSQAMTVLLKYLSDPDSLIGSRSVCSLVTIGDKSVPALISIIQGSDEIAKERAEDALVQFSSLASSAIIDTLSANTTSHRYRLENILRQIDDDRSKNYFTLKTVDDSPLYDKYVSKVKVSYHNLSNKFQSIISKYEKLFVNRIINIITQANRDDVFPIKIEFGSSDSRLYVLLNIMHKGLDRIKPYDDRNGLFMLDVSFPVKLTQSPIWTLIKYISDDTSIPYQYKYTISKIEPIVRYTKLNGNYFEMYIQSDGTWYNDVCVYMKNTGTHYVKHASNIEVIGAYQILIFERPEDSLTGKLNERKYVFDFFDFH